MQCSESAKPIKAVWHMYSVQWKRNIENVTKLFQM